MSFWKVDNNWSWPISFQLALPVTLIQVHPPIDIELPLWATGGGPYMKYTHE